MTPTKMLWFHAFGHGTVKDVLGVLETGPEPHPLTTSTTRQHEDQLGITPPRVYAYLGRTLHEFGDSAFAIEFHEPTGEISPFDSGGLVKKLNPVASWPDNEKRVYLFRYTWSSAVATDRVTEYPGSEPTRLQAYLQSARPTFIGPHQIWPSPITAEIEAEIWSVTQNATGDWRDWTWEVRVPGRLQTGDRIQAWSCSPTMYQKILDFALSDSAKTSWYQSLVRKYVRGGTRELVAQLLHVQEDACLK